MAILKKTWKEKRTKKAECPLSWKDQKARSDRQKQDKIKDKEIKEQLKMKKRAYQTEQKRLREMREVKNKK